MTPKNCRAPDGVPRIPRARRAIRKRRLAGLDRLAHEIVNQITVINLSCFKLRATLKNVAATVNPDIERLEKAVAEMNSLIEMLSQIEAQAAASNISACPKATANANSTPTNVYPLFETKQTSG
jgi:hypothetical protein